MAFSWGAIPDDDDCVLLALPTVPVFVAAVGFEFGNGVDDDDDCAGVSPLDDAVIFACTIGFVVCDVAAEVACCTPHNINARK